MDNVKLAQAIRDVSALHEASYDKSTERYSRRYSECIREVVGNDPVGMILACLFAAGYCEMFDFADQVLGCTKEYANL